MAGGAILLRDVGAPIAEVAAGSFGHDLLLAKGDEDGGELAEAGGEGIDLLLMRVDFV